jgi:hypothetical protein
VVTARCGESALATVIARIGPIASALAVGLLTGSVAGRLIVTVIA